MRLYQWKDIEYEEFLALRRAVPRFAIVNDIYDQSEATILLWDSDYAPVSWENYAIKPPHEKRD